MKTRLFVGCMFALAMFLLWIATYDQRHSRLAETQAVTTTEATSPQAVPPVVVPSSNATNTNIVEARINAQFDNK